MQAALIPSEFETRTNATYEALMWAMSRPGLPRELPAAGLGPLIETLIDRECAVHCDDDALRASAAQTGASLVEIAQADHVFLSATPTMDLLRQLAQGSDLYPDNGATLICPAAIGNGPHLRLSGPGVNGTQEVSLGGLPDGFWQCRREIMRYPQGFEIFFIDQQQVIGLPRSTQVEVL